MDDSLSHFLARLAVVQARVAAVVGARRVADADPDDRFRGLYVSDAHVDALLAAEPAAPIAPSAEADAALAEADARADTAEAAGATLRLRRLAAAFELDAWDVELLLIALAPDVEPRFEKLYAYLNDDVSRRRASVGLALELCGAPTGGGRERARLGPASRLVEGGLVVVEDSDRPVLTRALRVPDRVTSHLLGDDTPDAALLGLIVQPVQALIGPVDVLRRALSTGQDLTYVRERIGAAGSALAVAAFAEAGLPVVALDLMRWDHVDDLRTVATAAVREARLRGGGLVVGPVEALAELGAPGVRQFAEAACPTVLIGARGWDPAWAHAVPLLLDAAVPTSRQRADLWRTALVGAGLHDASTNGSTPALDAAGATTSFRLTPDQVSRAAAAAVRSATAQGRAVGDDDLRAGARAQNAAGLERLARRIEPVVGWEDLVLPPELVVQLHELSARVRQRERVLDDWGMGSKSSKGRGITGLFAGDSGTGKTMSAEVVAGDLGLDLYIIDLSTVVDKYIGETEKNLDRIFGEAERVNGVLLFDEADALFGKRSEVNDARDRYANVEVAYLLQRMEQFNGMALLTTNLRSNVDEAFTRRLDAIVDFPMPEEEDRLRLWQVNLRHDVPQTDDIDLPFLAQRFRLSGGNIRNIVVTAAYLAADEGRDLSMMDLVRGTEREYRKLGRLCHESEFGPYFRLLSSSWGSGTIGSASGRFAPLDLPGTAVRS